MPRPCSVPPAWFLRAIATATLAAGSPLHAGDTILRRDDAERSVWMVSESGGLLSDLAIAPGDRYAALLHGMDVPVACVILCDLQESQFVIRETLDRVAFLTSGEAPEEQIDSIRLLSPALAFSPDGTSLAVARYSSDGDSSGEGHSDCEESQILEILSVEDGSVHRTSSKEAMRIDGLCWSPDGTRLAGLDAGRRRILVWPADLSGAPASVEVGPDRIDLAWTGNSAGLVCVGSVEQEVEDGSQRTLRNATWHSVEPGVPPAELLRVAHPWHPRELRHSREGELIFSLQTRADGIELRGWNLEKGRELFCFAEPPGRGEYARLCHALAPDLRHAALGYDDGRILLVDTATGACVAEFEDHRRDVTSVRFSGDGHRLFSLSWDGTLSARDVSQLVR